MGGFTRTAVAWKFPISPDGTKRNVLIIGAGGYIGPVLSEHLLGLGYGVRALDLFLYGTEEVLGPFAGRPGFDLVSGDHCDWALMEDAFDGVTDVVILSGLVGDPITKKYPDAHRAINDVGMGALIDMAAGRGLGNVMFASTCSNYGLIGEDDLAGEDFPLTPLSPYAKAKVSMEEKLLGLRGEVDYRPTVLRFATAFGLAPRMRFDLTVSQFVRYMFLGKDMLVYDAETWRPYCHVHDFADVIARVLEAPEDDVSFEVFNVGGTINNFTKQMIVDAILEFLPGAAVRYQEQGPDPRNYRVDFAKIRERLGFEPHYSVRDGIGELIEALEDGRFADIGARPNFHGNYEIDYPPAIQ